jgi:hypothetical protein
MRAIAKTRAGPGLELVEVPVPEPGINDVLIKVRKTGICGTDLHIYKWDAWAQKTIRCRWWSGMSSSARSSPSAPTSDFIPARSSAPRATSSAGAAATASPDAATSAKTPSASA